MRKRFRINGFTLAEVLVAMVFLAIVLPVAVQGVLIANRAGSVADHKRTAAQLADLVLSEWIATEDWLEGDTSGDFEEDWPGYSWELTTESWEGDEDWDENELMRLITVEVFFKVQGHEYSVRLSTLAQEEEVYG